MMDRSPIFLALLVACGYCNEAVSMSPTLRSSFVSPSWLHFNVRKSCGKLSTSSTNCISRRRAQTLASMSVSPPSDTNSETSTENQRELARQLMQENAMPSISDLENAREIYKHASHPQDPMGHYDVDTMTPMESEFHSLMSTFLTYSQRDIQSLTTTSSRYYKYGHENDVHHQQKPHTRTKEEGIRYRVLYEGVQSGALEPAVKRSFSVLFEDYMPIRIAGRRIYGYLAKVMEEVREERRGECLRAKDVTGWDCLIGEFSEVGSSDEHIIDYARKVWDTIMDEALLLEHSLETDAEEEKCQEVGFISLPQLKLLNIDQLLMESSLVQDGAELESFVREILLAEDMEMSRDSHANHNLHRSRGGQYLEMTFVSFMKLLQKCIMENSLDTNDRAVVTRFLQKVETGLRRQSGSSNTHETSTLLAAKAVQSGTSNTCKKRQKNSARFDEYVSTFKVWERNFLGDERQPSLAMKSKTDNRRLDILRGCFEGARNDRVVAALKIVYMDYTALRLAGDLIFKLMSKIVK